MMMSWSGGFHSQTDKWERSHYYYKPLSKEKIKGKISLNEIVSNKGIELKV
jgi:hypothetical protein